MKIVLVFTSFVKVCPDLQSLWVSLRLWIKSIVINSLDRRPPSHQDSSASRLSISNLSTLTPANHRPLTSLAPPLTMRRERETLRERTEKEGWTSGWPCTAAFFHLHLLQPSKKREREKKRWISLLLTTMQLLLQHAQEASAPPLSAGLQ